MEALLSETYTPHTESPSLVTLDRKDILYRQRRYWRLKRAMDVLLSLLALVILWPFFLLIALVIYIDSPGASPFFVQDRVGRDGKLFRFYKFRSMVPDAEAKLEDLRQLNEMDGPAFKIKNDPRVTRVGRFLRKSSIDELPQLLNVLRGDMSIVGPRPALPNEVAQYTDYQKQRLIITPGLTCYWQIQPNRNQLDFDTWMALDIRYIQERSFLTDWKIIFKTFGTVLKMQGT